MKVLKGGLVGGPRLAVETTKGDGFPLVVGWASCRVGDKELSRPFRLRGEKKLKEDGLLPTNFKILCLPRSSAARSLTSEKIVLGRMKQPT